MGVQVTARVAVTLSIGFPEAGSSQAPELQKCNIIKRRPVPNGCPAAGFSQAPELQKCNDDMKRGQVLIAFPAAGSSKASELQKCDGIKRGPVPIRFSAAESS